MKPKTFLLTSFVFLNIIVSSPCRGDDTQKPVLLLTDLTGTTVEIYEPKYYDNYPLNIILNNKKEGTLELDKIKTAVFNANDKTIKIESIDDKKYTVKPREFDLDFAKIAGCVQIANTMCSYLITMKFIKKISMTKQDVPQLRSMAENKWENGCEVIDKAGSKYELANTAFFKSDFFYTEYTRIQFSRSAIPARRLSDTNDLEVGFGNGTYLLDRKYVAKISVKNNLIYFADHEANPVPGQIKNVLAIGGDDKYGRMSFLWADIDEISYSIHEAQLEVNKSEMEYKNLKYDLLGYKNGSTENYIKLSDVNSEVFSPGISWASIDYLLAFRISMKDYKELGEPNQKMTEIVVEKTFIAPLIPIKIGLAHYSIRFSAIDDIVYKGKKNIILQLGDGNSINGSLYENWTAFTGQVSRGKKMSINSRTLPDKIQIITSDPKKATVAGHEDAVTSVAYSPDGRILVSGSRDKKMKIWNAGTGENISTIDAHKGLTEHIAFSPDGKCFASRAKVAYTYYQEIKLWRTDDFAVIATLTNIVPQMNSFAFSHSGKIIATSSQHGVISLYDTTTGDRIRSFTGNPSTNEIWAVAFSHDDKMLISGANNGIVLLWETDSGKLIKTVNNPKNGEKNIAISSVGLSPDGKIILAGDFDHTLKMWNMGSGKLISSFIKNHPAVAQSIYTMDGKHAAIISHATGYDSMMNIIDLTNGKLIKQHKTKYLPQVVLSPDGKTIAACCYDGTVQLWDFPSGNLLSVIRGPKGRLHSISYSPDGKTVAAGCEDKMIYIINTEMNY